MTKSKKKIDQKSTTLILKKRLELTSRTKGENAKQSQYRFEREDKPRVDTEVEGRKRKTKREYTRRASL